MDRNAVPLFRKGDKEKSWETIRNRIINEFSENVYGHSPKAPEIVEGHILKTDAIAFAGKATHQRVDIKFDTPDGIYSFPVDFLVPNIDKSVPLIIFLSFHHYKESYETPIEEIVDNGFALAIIDYQTITSDDDSNTGLAKLYPFKKKNNDWGKIGIWAYAVSRVMDYALTLPQIDEQHILCAGHSRLGKTVLWCAVLDTRFWGVFANNSGCSGVAVSVGKKGERIKDIYTKFPYWFCNNYGKYMDNEDSMTFDQHQLVACMAPRHLYTCSAEEDSWADPESEYLSCCLATEAYKKIGKTGLIGENRNPCVGDIYHKGEIGYHMRKGEHFLSRYDWVQLMKYAKKHMYHD